MRKETCNHIWRPLVDLSIGCGSLGSQIGYHCEKCKTDDIRWEKGHYYYGSEEEIVNLNKIYDKTTTYRKSRKCRNKTKV